MASLLINPVVIPQGTSVTVDFDLTDADGAVIDLTDANKSLTLAFVGQGSITGTTLTRVSTTAAHVNWRTQASGKGTWKFLATESLTAGTYKVSVYYKDTADVLTPRLLGTTVYKIVAAPSTVP